jgi:predicted nucleic acid-binding protein
MIYLDAAYIVRLYVEDHGWQMVRELAAQASVASALHGRAEVIGAFHRKFREGTFTRPVFHSVLDQFQYDCDHQAYRWLPLSPAVLQRAQNVYRVLPASAFVRAADALHLATAAENRFRQVYSNDEHLLGAARHFALTALNIIR